nr:hypothetical protein [Tanacetum cinerariifolium]
MGKFRETLVDGALGLERDRVIKDLTPKEKERYKTDIRATNILLQVLPKDIYTLINHYTDAKDIWDNMKMLLEGSELTRDERLTPTDDLIENLTKTVALLAQSYKTHLPQTNNQLRTSSNTRHQATVQNKRVVVHNVQSRQNRVQGNNARGAVAAGNEGVHNTVGNANPDSTFDDDVDEPPVQDLALNMDQVFQADQCDAFDSDVDEAPTTQTMFMVNVSSADLIYDEAGPSYDSDILSEVQDHDNYLDNVGEYHKVHEMQNDVQQNYVVDSDAEYTSDNNIIPYEQYVKNNAEQVVQSNVSFVPNDALMKIINDMHEQDFQCISGNE